MTRANRPRAHRVIGALAVYPFGPMLIVFGMFGLGGLAVLFREIRLYRTRTV